MTAIALRPPGRIARPTVILAGLAAVVGLRWQATVQGGGGALAIGLLFGLGLIVIALVSGWRPGLGRPASLAFGGAGGAVLVVLAIATRSGHLPWFASAPDVVPWVAVTVLVATAEEVVLRGALFDALDASLGSPGAVLITSAVFALMHVPLYGWHVVPLDLGAGLWLAGLRLTTGGISAPAIAHTVADLASRWL